MARILSVHSFRGGTGKSNTTANVATILAARGKRVGIIDTDIQSPGIHVLFNVSEDEVVHTLDDYLWGNVAIEEAAIDVGSKLTMADGRKGLAQGALYLVPSSMKAGDIARILREGYDVGLLNDGYRALLDKLRLDYLLIDTHPGLNEETLLSISVSDVLLLILRPDKQDFQGTAVTVDVARKLDVENLMLVVNKVLESFDFAEVKQQVEATYEATVAGVLPNSDDIVRLASGDIFSLRFPDHRWSQEITKIVDHVQAVAP
ncbi:MAG TPA: MinD/ParA family protein [Chloroflexota bacterium]|jgi:MinD-like ATPase involved in chromosome partitioning or flagellar assembly|nr:MinD/ParA family protein [Chloroflexota bacterium]